RRVDGLRRQHLDQRRLGPGDGAPLVAAEGARAGPRRVEAPDALQAAQRPLLAKLAELPDHRVVERQAGGGGRRGGPPRRRPLPPPARPRRNAPPPWVPRAGPPRRAARAGEAGPGGARHPPVASGLAGVVGAVGVERGVLDAQLPDLAEVLAGVARVAVAR